MKSNRVHQLLATIETISDSLKAKELLRSRPPPIALLVLIVDDDKNRCVTSSKLIEGFGHRVESAQDGISALRNAAANRPDIVLISTELQFNDDCNIAAHLRSDYPIPPPLIIGLTTQSNWLMRQQSVDAGMDLILESPLNAAVIETLLALECDKQANDPIRNPVAFPRRAIARKHRGTVSSNYRLLKKAFHLLIDPARRARRMRNDLFDPINNCIAVRCARGGSQLGIQPKPGTTACWWFQLCLQRLLRVRCGLAVAFRS